MRIFLCEDEVLLRKQYLEVIQAYLTKSKLSVKVSELNTPTEILTYIKEQPSQPSLYFLDIDLGPQMNGIQLALKIRQHGPTAKIVFITTHEEMAPLVFKYKIEAMDFIEKSTPDVMKQKIEECLTVFFQRQEQLATDQPFFQINSREQTLLIPIQEILFFEALHQNSILTLHTLHGHHEFYGTFKEIEGQSPNFIRTHKSCLVNKQNVRLVDRKKLEIEMINGQRCMISRRKIKQFFPKL